MVVEKTGVLQQVDTKLLIPTPDNNRTIRADSADIASLTESIAQMGMLQPLIARPHPKLKNKFDLRAGERRLVAARRAKLTTVPVIVREMTDREAVEITVTENLQRENLHPIEEARGIQTMLDAGWDADSIGSKLGKTASWVARRARLTALIEPIAKALQEPGHPLGRVPLGIIERIARLPTETQEKIGADIEVRGGSYTDLSEEYDSVEAFEQYTNREYVHRLSGVPWKLDDGELLPEAGSCLACPKRSGHPCQHLLFAAEDDEEAIKQDDQCLDAECFLKKSERSVKGRIADARTKHPGLILVDKGQYHERGRVEKAFGKQVRGAHSFTGCKAKAPGAHPALVVNGAGLGKVEYVRLNGYNDPSASSSRPKRADGTAVPPTMKERRAKLQGRRDAHVVDAVAERLLRIVEGDYPSAEETIEGESPVNFADEGDRELLGLVAAFGTHEQLLGCHAGSDWKEFDNLLRGPLDYLERKVTELVAGAWLCRVEDARRASLPTFASPIADAKRMCPFLGLEYSDLQASAAEAIPEPKGWANLKADGTPKTAKTKKPKPGKKVTKKPKATKQARTFGVKELVGLVCKDAPEATPRRKAKAAKKATKKKRKKPAKKGPLF